MIAAARPNRPSVEILAEDLVRIIPAIAKPGAGVRETAQAKRVRDQWRRFAGAVVGHVMCRGTRLAHRPAASPDTCKQSGLQHRDHLRQRITRIRPRFVRVPMSRQWNARRLLRIQDARPLAE
jgi:hypothetical protein